MARSGSRLSLQAMAGARRMSVNQNGTVPVPSRCMVVATSGGRERRSVHSIQPDGWGSATVGGVARCAGDLPKASNATEWLLAPAAACTELTAAGRHAYTTGMSAMICTDQVGALAYVYSCCISWSVRGIWYAPLDQRISRTSGSLTSPSPWPFEEMHRLLSAACQRQ